MEICCHRLFSEAMDVDKHNSKYRHLLREAKQQHLLATRVRLSEFAYIILNDLSFRLITTLSLVLRKLAESQR